MAELYLTLDGEVLHARHERLAPGRPVLVCLHGLGDAHLAWNEAFDRPELADWAVVAPDLPGHGRSSTSTNYDFSSMAQRVAQLLEHLAHFGLDAGQIHLVAHSMGALPALRLARSWEREPLPHAPGHQGNGPGLWVRSLALVEGSVTQYGAFISGTVSRVAAQGGFDEWFQRDFQKGLLLDQYVQRFPFTSRYLAAVAFCRPEAFLDAALAMHAEANALERPWTHAGGRLFARLRLPRIYFYGRSMVPQTLEFLAMEDIPTRELEADSHFLMTEKPDAFYPALASWLNQCREGSA